MKIKHVHDENKILKVGFKKLFYHTKFKNKKYHTIEHRTAY